MSEISNPIPKYFKSDHKKKRKETEAEVQQQDHVETAKRLGMEESDLYLKNQLREPQHELLDEGDEKSADQIDEYSAKAGLTEDQEKTMIAEMKLDRQIMEASMHENTWTKAVQSLGYSMKETAKIIAQYRAEARERKTAYMKLMQTIAIVGVSVWTGGAGTVPLAAGLSALDRQRNADEDKGIYTDK